MYKSPILSFSLTKPIRSKLLNYKQALDEFSCSNQLPSYKKKKSNFIYSPAGHVLTGNINFIQNDELKRLFLKGPNYRLDKPIIYDDIFEHISSRLNTFIKSWTKKENVSETTLFQWKTRALNILRNRVMNLKNSSFKTKTNQRISRVMLSNLSNIQKDFVITTVDKASTNFVFICKHYYLKVISDELGFFSNTSNNTYHLINTSGEKVIDEISQNVAQILNKTSQNSQDCNNKTLPFMYWIPKLHKIPYKSRFITSAKLCCTTNLSKLVTEGLKLVRTFWNNYCKVIFKNSRINKFWSINNSLTFVNLLTSVHKIRSISTFDFSTLYTSLPQDQLIEASHNFLQKPFLKNKFLITNGYKTFWSNNKDSFSKSYYAFSFDVFFESLEYLINNSFLTFGNKIYQQKIGIPMGANYSPLLADLFLFYKEYTFMDSIDINYSYSFQHICRYIDDVSVINFPEFDNYLKTIYPACLEITKSPDAESVHYLDVKINIKHPIEYTIFDKREEFNFEIINFPHITSNAPKQLFKAVYTSQLFRLIRLNSSANLFMNRLKILTEKLASRGYNKTFLKNVFERFKINNNICFSDGSSLHNTIFPL